MINKKWDIVLRDEFNKTYFKELGVFVKEEYANALTLAVTKKDDIIIPNRQAEIFDYAHVIAQYEDLFEKCV